MSILSTNIAPADVHVTRGWKKELINYIGIAFGTMLYGLGYTVFMLSYHLTSGGIGGVSAIVYYATGFEPQITYGLINMIFLAVALKLLGWKFCVKTIWGVLMSTFWFWAWQRIIENPDGTLPMIVGNERFMAAIMGAMIEGVGMVFCFSNNGSTGGTDIVAACINKYKDMSLGTVILGCDIVIISSCYFIFHDIEMVMFGYVLMAVCALTLDYVTRYVHQAVEFKIFSRNYEAIAEAIHNAGFGVTVLDGTGWHTKTERKVVVCIASKRYSPVIARAVKRVDPFAFLSVTNTEGVYGEGFETMKTKVKNQKPIIVFATNNANKLREVRQILENKYEVRSLKEIGCTVDLPETSDNLKDNALQKAKFIKDFYGFDCFADDTGLEVEALDGKPGVYSARYATIAEEGWEATVNDHDSQANMNKLLTMLDGKENRKAQFRTVIALIQGDNTYYFEGIVKGDITTERHGDEGFGYDPVFRPEGYSTTFAEMASEEKNKISHRGRAVQKLVEHLG